MSIATFIRLLLTVWSAVGQQLARIAKMPFVLHQGGIFIGIPSSGSVGNNGALTGLTVQNQLAAGGYMYFPADKIAVGVAAGLYWVVMSGTTAGTIYNNKYTGGKIEQPATLVPFVTTGPGAFTQSLIEITLFSLTIPGGIIGPYGSLRLRLTGYNNNNANTKTYKASLGAFNFLSIPVTATWSLPTMKSITNRGVQTSQIAGYIGSGDSGPINANNAYGSVDTSADTVLTVTGQLAVASDFIYIESIVLEVIPS